MRVLFARKTRFSVTSWLLRFACWSHWSHSAAMLNETTVVHSTFSGGGVHVTPLAEFMAEYTVEECVVPLFDEGAALDFLRFQVGKPYDWTALVGFLIRRDWAARDSWFCSELVEAAVAAGGVHRFRAEVMDRITPQHQWMLAPY